MAHFAKVENGIVTNVIVAEQDFIDTLEDKNSWIKTSYNTRGGVHYEANTNNPSKDGVPLRKNYAGIGYTYDLEKDAFIPPKPFNSWLLNEETCLWEAPVLKPNDELGIFYRWDESKNEWYIPDFFDTSMEALDEIEDSYVDVSQYYDSYTETDNFYVLKKDNQVGLFTKELNNQLIMTNGTYEKIWNYDFVKKAKGDVLIGGLGIGLIVLAIQDKPEVTSITIVEKFQDIKDFISSKLPFNNKVNIIVSDFFDYKVPEGIKYDTMFIDLYGDVVSQRTWFLENYSQYKRNEDSYIEAFVEFDVTDYLKKE